MYYRIKSRKVVIDNYPEQSLLFCTFINQDRILLLFKNGNFCVVDHSLSSKKKIVYQDNIQKESNILDCKRIKPNVCAILTKKMSPIMMVQYISDQQILIGAIQTQQLQVLMNLSTKNQFLGFNNKQFAIMSQSQKINCTYFTFFNQTQEEFNYNINSKSYPQPINPQGFTIKPIELKSQIAFYKQKYNEFDKVITFLRLSQSLQNQEVDLNEVLEEGDFINDVVAKSADQYYLFILKYTNNGTQIHVFTVKCIDDYGKYTATFEKSMILQVANPLCTQIINVDIKKNFYLVKSYAHICQNGHVYDNYLQVRNLQTHQVIEKVACNIKSIDLSPSKFCFVDYSQQVAGSFDIVLHIRTIFSKTYLYGFLLNSSPIFENQNIKKIHSNIIDLL